MERISDLHISLQRRGKLSAEVYRQLRAAILDGRLRPGESLPATRELARRLDVSRNTVMNAYERLIAEGFLAGKIGAGTFVAETGSSAGESRRAPVGRALAPRPLWRTLTTAFEHRRAAKYDFRLGAPDPSLFPWDEWRRLVARQLRGRKPFAGYAPPEGDPSLRAAIARHVGIARAVRAGADDVIVTNGAQQAIDLIGRVLLEPGAQVAVEDPGYPEAWRALAAQGAKIVPVRVDQEGLVVDALPQKARLVYVTPSHQFPLGMPMSLSRRLALLAWAERQGAAIVEDDYDSELRYEGRPLEPLQSLDRAGRVLYVGTFSKVLSPTLRMGFVVAPQALAPALRTARALNDSHGPLELQRALSALIDSGALARHVRRILRVYEERRARLHAALTHQLGDQLVILPSLAGLHASVLFHDRRLDIDALATRALAAEVAIQPLRGYYQTRPRPGIALGFGLISSAKIDEGVRRLAETLRASAK
jgi:GntR family transcriptional regulator/MocR family aminotransferase